MLSARRGTTIILWLFALTAVLPITAQDELSVLRADWRAQRYREVLQPLLDYRDTLGDQSSFDVDYMIGTAMCHWPQFKSDGRAYLANLRQAYGNNAKFDGRVVAIPQSISFHCGNSGSGGCAEVGGKADCAGVDGKADGLTGGETGRSPLRSPQGIRDSVKNRLRPSLVLEADIDRPGQDYRSFGLTKPQPELCRQECAKDLACKAFTYVRPSYQGANAVCWLKSAVPERSASKCCVSGVK